MNVIQIEQIHRALSLIKPQKSWFFLIICLLLLSSCRANQWYSADSSLQNWQYSDVRALDAIDAEEPQQELIAIYSRLSDRSVKLRVDFLELPAAGKQDIYFLFDTNPGGVPVVNLSTSQDLRVDIRWDYLIKIPGTGNVMIYNDQYIPVEGLALLIVRDPSIDSLMLSFLRSILPITNSRTYIQVVIASPGTNQILDKSDVFSIDAPSPARGKILFAFWNTFSSATPAQALRSWAGAHTGPMSSRHGLKYLIDSAVQSNIPIYLSDLDTPDNKSALDYLGVLPFINTLVDNEVIYINQKEVNLNNWLDLVKDNLSKIYNKILMIGENDYAKFYINESCPFILQNNDALYLTNEDSLTICKIFLLNIAIYHPTLPVILGGDFSTSLLGDPSISKEFFGYIKSHPWIQALPISYISTNLSSINSVTNQILNHSNSTKPSVTEFGNTSNIAGEIYNSLNQLPDNNVSNLAKSVYRSLTQPAEDNLEKLRNNYLGQVGFLIQAAEWVNDPQFIETCDFDLDYDNQRECILANNNIYLVIDLEGGFIPLLVTVDTQGDHQIIGPTWEFLVGMSDISEGDNSKGIFSDPGQIIGAFFDKNKQLHNYDYVLSKSRVDIVSEEMTIRKSFSVTRDSLHVEISNTLELVSDYYIPLVLDPWTRYYPDWGDLYAGEKFTYTFYWGITSGEKVEIKTTVPFIVHSFNDTRPALALDEDPNFDYTQGHYLPFPMSLVKIMSTNNFSVDIIINP